MRVEVSGLGCRLQALQALERVFRAENAFLGAYKCILSTGLDLGCRV